MTEHPITPPPELVEQWCEQLFGCPNKPKIAAYELVRLGAQWGADQELEACCVWVNSVDDDDCFGANLRAARRPKPPSLKEQALEMLGNAWEGGHINNNAAQTIRRALEQLHD
jgi:hypothetical protein